MRFGLVGASGFVVNEGLLFALHGKAHLPLLLASAIAIECAIISNYLWNDRWTFGHPTPSLQRFFRFNAVSLVSLVVNASVLGLATSLTPLHYLAANLIGVAVAFGVNYALNVYWTYGRALAAPDALDAAAEGLGGPLYGLLPPDEPAPG
jgi:dolichol-phosphate mannosyltransferase